MQAAEIIAPAPPTMPIDEEVPDSKPIVHNSSSKEADQPGITGLRLEGWLDKKSDYFGRNNARYCRLSEDGVLSWYDNMLADVARGAISLVGAEVSTQEVDAFVRESTGEETAATALLIIKAPLRGSAPIIFRCPDAEVRDAWAAATSEIAARVTAEKVKAIEAARLAELNAAEEKRAAAEERQRLAAEERARAAEEKRRLAEERKKSKRRTPERTTAASEPTEPPRSPSGVSRGMASPFSSTEGTTTGQSLDLLASEIAKLVNPEVSVLGEVLNEHDECAHMVAAKGEAAAAEVRRIQEQQTSGASLKEWRLAEIDAASAALRSHVNALSIVVAEEVSSREGIDGAEGMAKSKAKRLAAEEVRRRDVIRTLEEERVALLEAQQAEKAELDQRIVDANKGEADSASELKVTSLRCELRAERRAVLEGKLEAIAHEQTVATATLEGLRIELGVAATRKTDVEAALQTAVNATGDIASDIARATEADTTAKLLAQSNHQRLTAALTAATEYARVVASYAKAKPKDPTYESTQHCEAAVATVAEVQLEGQVTKEEEGSADVRAAGMVAAIQAQLDAATAEEEARAHTAADDLRMLRARATATEVTMRAKRAHLAELVSTWQHLLNEVAAVERAIAEAAALEAALIMEQATLNDESAKLEETLGVQRKASEATLTKMAELRAEDKVLAVRHIQALAAVDAHLAEERTHCDALALKKAPTALGAAGSVVVIERSLEGSNSTSTTPPSDLPSLLCRAVDEAKAGLARLEEMRLAVVRDHTADAKQLATLATIASATVAATVAQSAAHDRARSALARFEAAMVAA